MGVQFVQLPMGLPYSLYYIIFKYFYIKYPIIFRNSDKPFWITFIIPSTGLITFSYIKWNIKISCSIFFWSRRLELLHSQHLIRGVWAPRHKTLRKSLYRWNEDVKNGQNITFFFHLLEPFTRGGYGHLFRKRSFFSFFPNFFFFLQQ